ncbi:ATP-binding cassette domain-containing protein [Chitinimonas arctica]|uniref:Cell division ATP-binding protein FtsE n=1 Tax=Chitinimonas arctica TaxID=2594795 RepID=A0A516SE44_9NEIS|nr:ATP-binding cassette domain-containing protein [Chitinimonas arctica]QDQ26429.1 ATP-binding cassette domain-containing protein [Chitinimonas arctica]
MIALQHLSKTYRAEGRSVHALRDINLQIPQGQIFGIIGRSGAGKSSLLRSLNLLERPDSGSIRIAGEEITTLDAAGLRALRRRIGMVFQHFNLLSHRNVAGNVRFPLELAGGHTKADIEARVNELLELVGLTEQREQFPSQLSGGQKQRVGIARALATQPQLLLCDEATSALDPETTLTVLQLLLDINRRLGLTIVLITHEMAVVRAICDRVAVIDDGAIVESGPVAEVFLHPRHHATRRIVAEGAYTPLPTLGKQGATSTRLLRLTFLDGATYEPIIADVGQQLDAPINILQGSIGRIKDRPYGQLIIGFDGNAVRARRAFEARGVHVEELTA